MTPYIGSLADDPAWKKAFTFRVRRMVERDKAQPCVIAWSLGNESGYGAIHDDLAAWVRQRDPSRMVFYEPASYGARVDGHGNTIFSAVAAGGVMGGNATTRPATATDVLCPMYARISECITLANVNPDMPLILSEYCHMMGEKPRRPLSFH